jgi:hypothetical protein
MEALSIPQIAELLGAGATEIAVEMHALPPELVGWHPAPGEWCVKECVGHLIEAERRGFAGRIRFMLEHGDGEALTSWDQVAVAQARNDCDAGTPGLVRELAEERSRSVELVKSLQPPDLAIGGEHPEVGHVTIGEVLHEWVHHDRNHLRQILATVQAYAWPAMGNIQRFSLPR